MRATEARLKDVPEPTDPSRHSSVKDPTEPFKFSFPDMKARSCRVRTNASATKC